MSRFNWSSASWWNSSVSSRTRTFCRTRSLTTRLAPRPDAAWAHAGRFGRLQAGRAKRGFDDAAGLLLLARERDAVRSERQAVAAGHLAGLLQARRSRARTPPRPRGRTRARAPPRAASPPRAAPHGGDRPARSASARASASSTGGGAGASPARDASRRAPAARHSAATSAGSNAGAASRARRRASPPRLARRPAPPRPDPRAGRRPAGRRDRAARSAPGAAAVRMGPRSGCGSSTIPPAIVTGGE